MVRQLNFVCTIALILIHGCSLTSSQTANDDLAVEFAGNARIEVGGPFVGAEFHNSYPVPQRISFFYPVANSIDISEDYWLRDTTVVLDVGLKIGSAERRDLSRKPAPFSLTPYSVSFHSEDSLASLRISYQFCETQPAIVICYRITNRGASREAFELDTRLNTSLRSCHTFRRIENAWTEYSLQHSAITANFSDMDVQAAQVFVANAAEQPVAYSGRADADVSPSGSETLLHPLSRSGKPAAAFLYRKELAPRETMEIVQIVGSCRAGEASERIDFLAEHYEREVTNYENNIRQKAYTDYTFRAANPVMDHSVRWAKAILAANIHYLDGDFVPMPCPAEYNFYFTHDALVTDLAAVNFDLPRVKTDLQYLLKHANDQQVIPHAYYWKDNQYVTEYADSNNWNHFWFIQVAASYLRHSADVELLRKCYPFLRKSLDYTLHSREADGLLYAYYLDGWDIGHNFGPRAYMTIMAIKAIRDYIYIATVLDENTGQLLDYEQLAKQMEQSLADKLWSDEAKFLINFYEDGSVDPHYYAGSLLAAHFGLLDGEKRQLLIETAGEKLVDDQIGCSTVYPPDFHLLGDFLKFKGNEVGPPYLYANGGIWNHANAWYALGLIANNRRAEACEFIRRIMTLDGIINSPNGQPAMYEFRCSNFNDPEMYGKIDKPQFLWAAGWYLYALYHLYGIEENSWNIALYPYLPENQASCVFDVTSQGKRQTVHVHGKGEFIRSIRIGSKRYAAAIVPESISKNGEIEIILGKPELPYIASTEAILLSCDYNPRTFQLQASLRAFPGHHNELVIISPYKPEQIRFGGDPAPNATITKKDEIYIIRCELIHHAEQEDLLVLFNASER